MLWLSLSSMSNGKGGTRHLTLEESDLSDFAKSFFNRPPSNFVVALHLPNGLKYDAFITQYHSVKEMCESLWQEVRKVARAVSEEGEEAIADSVAPLTTAYHAPTYKVEFTTNFPLIINNTLTTSSGFELRVSYLNADLPQTFFTPLPPGCPIEYVEAAINATVAKFMPENKVFGLHRFTRWTKAGLLSGASENGAIWFTEKPAGLEWAGKTSISTPGTQCAGNALVIMGKVVKRNRGEARATPFGSQDPARSDANTLSFVEIARNATPKPLPTPTTIPEASSSAPKATASVSAATPTPSNSKAPSKAAPTAKSSSSNTKLKHTRSTSELRGPEGAASTPKTTTSRRNSAASASAASRPIAIDLASDNPDDTPDLFNSLFKRRKRSESSKDASPTMNDPPAKRGAKSGEISLKSPTIPRNSPTSPTPTSSSSMDTGF